ncbi:MAG: prolipoprotein diacylglyceryl transferase [Clostridiales bacterium]|jgi:phosphatidylglycerol:prolipoprotein diacylglycerol transferase|nr:prolipoprotein diacylglyceryl transferase [Clostridiales bacterium]
MAGESGGETVLKFSREAVAIGDFSIRFYGMLIALGVLLGVLLARSREQRLGVRRDTSLDLALVCVPAAIVGSRLYYVAFSWEIYRDDLLKIFSLREGGMAIYGGVLAGILAGWIFCRVRKLPFWKLADLAAPSIPLGQAIGRWGNFLNQEAFGTRVGNPSLQWFPLSVYIESDGAWHLATFFYESVWCFLIVAFLLIFERRKKFRLTGDMFLWYVLLYALGRALIEGLRTDSLMVAGFRASQLVAAALFVLAGVVLLVRRKLRF